MATHHYRAHTHWAGDTGLGWEHYERAHTASAPPATQELTVTTGESKGDPSQLNPEQLVLMAASSCQLLWFLHVASVARIEVVEYEDEAEAEMPEDDKPVRLTKIVLRPRIVVRPGPTEERVRHLVELAHKECYVANSLTTAVEVEPRIEIAGSV
ncbi:MAG TPA: OsmC family protein [Thermoleophilaceae bacterium]|jgi:organic hydroperoxide reductase OsmC/OhrA